MHSQLMSNNLFALSVDGENCVQKRSNTSKELVEKFGTDTHVICPQVDKSVVIYTTGDSDVFQMFCVEKCRRTS